MTIKPPNPSVPKPSPTENSEQLSIVNLSDIIGNLFFYAPKATASFSNDITNALLDSGVVKDTTTHRRNLYLLLTVIVSRYDDSRDLWGKQYDSSFRKSFHSKNDFENGAISSKFLPEYKSILKQVGIIDYSTSYFKDSFSKHFWLTCGLDDFKLVTLNQLGLPDFSPIRTNALLKYFYGLSDYYSVTDTERFLWSNLFKITVDSEANGFINNNSHLFPPSKVPSKCNNCGKRVARSKRKCDKCGSNNIIALPDVNQVKIAKRKLERMNKKRFQFRAASLKRDIESDDFLIDEKIQCRRIFTSVTSTKRELRQFLRYDGKALCEVDIHASQPLFATTLYDGKHAPKDERDKWVNLYPTEQHKGKSWSFNPPEDFYENFAALAGAKFNRETVKALLVKECFNDLDGYSKDGIKLKKQFVKMFPYLAEQIDKVKRATDYRKGESPKCAVSKGRFAIDMLNIEAGIMINGVCGEIQRDRKFFVTPIHDAVMVEADKVAITVHMIGQHTHEAIGIWPKVSVKNHGEKKLLTQSA